MGLVGIGRRCSQFFRRVIGDRVRTDIICDVRLVLDTDAVVAAMRSPSGASASIIRAVRHTHATRLLKVPLAIEYEPICKRPDPRAAAGLSVREVDTFVD